jgi:chromosome segregation ATPase
MTQESNAVQIINNPGPSKDQEQIGITMEISQNLLKRELNKEIKKAEEDLKHLRKVTQCCREGYDEDTKVYLKKMALLDKDFLTLFHRICEILENMEMEVPTDPKDIVARIARPLDVEKYIEDGVMTAYIHLEMHLFGEQVTMKVHFDQTELIMVAYNRFLEALKNENDKAEQYRDLRDRLRNIDDVCTDIKTDLLINQIRGTEGGDKILDNANDILTAYLADGGRKDISLLEG